MIILKKRHFYISYVTIAVDKCVRWQFIGQSGSIAWRMISQWAAFIR